MSLIDRTLISRKSSHTYKPWWEICTYCKQPFTTDTFDKTCQRCKHFEKYKDEFSSKVMLKFIFFTMASIIASSAFGPFLYKYIENKYHLALILLTLNVIIGISLWRAVKKLSK